MVINTKYAGMLNILANRQIVPELLQDKATPNNIARGVLNYLGNNSNYESFRKELRTARQLLAPYNGITKFAGYIGKYLNLTQNRS
jgi:lipid-A-disaccharide synthase